MRDQDHRCGLRSNAAFICVVSLAPAMATSMPLCELLILDRDLRIEPVTYTVQAVPTFFEVSSTGAFAILESHGIPAGDIWR
jgi:hypothetical protein